MLDDDNEPEELPVPPHAETRPGFWRRAALWLSLGGGIGLALGVLLTVSVTATYRLFTPTITPNRDWVQVFDELNELRQQVNQLNQARKLQDQETLQSIRQALSTVATTARSGESGTPGAVTPAKEPGGRTEMPTAARPRSAFVDPFAELDAEIKRLEDTQRVLNTILDMFTPMGKEPEKGRPGGAAPPK